MGGGQESSGYVVELELPPTKWGYWLASHENPGTGENTERSGKVIVVVVVVVVCCRRPGWVAARVGRGAGGSRRG